MKGGKREHKKEKEKLLRTWSAVECVLGLVAWGRSRWKKGKEGKWSVEMEIEKRRKKGSR
jgi:hypothetical protein